MHFTLRECLHGKMHEWINTSIQTKSKQFFNGSFLYSSWGGNLSTSAFTNWYSNSFMLNAFSRYWSFHWYKIITLKIANSNKNNKDTYWRLNQKRRYNWGRWKSFCNEKRRTVYPCIKTINFSTLLVDVAIILITKRPVNKV